MDLREKLGVLADAAKYDVSCSSSGSERNVKEGMIGNTALPGICHSWAADGRCISLLKVLLTNDCIYDCAYCVNRSSSDVKRAEFTPRELVKITMNFYRRNYIEGLFISSAVKYSPDYTMERMIEVVKILRLEEKYNGYIHLKAIPGVDQRLLDEAGLYVDRMSVNLELPTQKSLKLLAPQKDQKEIMLPMHYLRDKLAENKKDLIQFKSAQSFMPAGQTTQMMIGATKDSDFSIISISEQMYDKMRMKRVYYSGYVPIVQDNALLPTTVKSPLLREHRLYQADWLLRFYGFQAGEILSPEQPDLDLEVDPKCNWALKHIEYFPVEVNNAPIEMLLRVPGIGNITARRILQARRFGPVTYEELKKMGVVLKRAQYFILCSGKYYGAIDIDSDKIRNRLLFLDPKAKSINVNQIGLNEYFPTIFN
ncbi:MAG: putative DNA modification/repair radical SAM protein [Clostridia bacterium]|nr:putative DNA modification/repair radical SAM protein [Clostridia bacterium]